MSSVKLWDQEAARLRDQEEIANFAEGGLSAWRAQSRVP